METYLAKHLALASLLLRQVLEQLLVEALDDLVFGETRVGGYFLSWSELVEDLEVVSGDGSLSLEIWVLDFVQFIEKHGLDLSGLDQMRRFLRY